MLIGNQKEVSAVSGLTAIVPSGRRSAWTAKDVCFPVILFISLEVFGTFTLRQCSCLLHDMSDASLIELRMIVSIHNVVLFDIEQVLGSLLDDFERFTAPTEFSIFGSPPR